MVLVEGDRLDDENALPVIFAIETITLQTVTFTT
jgi:hypothetical protein